MDVVKCAEYHVDKHVVKMLLEYSQLLSNAHYFINKNSICKPSHFNHPCSIWVRSSKQNYIWLSQLSIALFQEYSYRYKKIHSWQNNIEWLATNIPDLSDIELTSFAQAMPDYCKNASDVVLAYRNYYCCEKRHIAKWTGRNIPFWYH